MIFYSIKILLNIKENNVKMKLIRTIYCIDNFMRQLINIII